MGRTYRLTENNKQDIDSISQTHNIMIIIIIIEYFLLSPVGYTTEY